MNQRVERAVRTIAALGAPESWEPYEFAQFEAARDVLRDEIVRTDRRAAQKPQRERRRHSGGWSFTAAREAVRERSGGTCEAATERCTRIAVHVHHKAGRVGPDPHHPDRLLHVCLACHDHIHRNPEESYEAGWMLRRLGRPA